MEKGLQPLTVEAFKKRMSEDDIIVLDTREAAIFTHGFVPGAISIGLEGRFAEWAGSLLPFTKTLLLVTEKGKEKETVTRLARVGFEKLEGYLDGGFEAWQAAGEPIDMIINVEPDELAMDLPFDNHLVVVDVRKEVEYADGHVKDAVNIPLETLTDPGSMADINEEDNLYIHCAGGYRSVIACSLIKRQGIHNLRNVEGGWNQIKEQEKIPVEKNAAILN
jgi:rhodanese-related sulfurtransferase